jgi:hypothetical protein
MIQIVVKEKTMPQLISRWEGILERGHAVSVYLKGGHKFHGMVSYVKTKKDTLFGMTQKEQQTISNWRLLLQWKNFFREFLLSEVRLRTVLGVYVFLAVVGLSRCGQAPCIGCF